MMIFIVMSKIFKAVVFLFLITSCSLIMKKNYNAEDIRRTKNIIHSLNKCQFTKALKLAKGIDGVWITRNHNYENIVYNIKDMNEVVPFLEILEGKYNLYRECKWDGADNGKISLERLSIIEKCQKNFMSTVDKRRKSINNYYYSKLNKIKDRRDLLYRITSSYHDIDNYLLHCDRNAGWIIRTTRKAMEWRAIDAKDKLQKSLLNNDSKFSTCYYNEMFDEYMEKINSTILYEQKMNEEINKRKKIYLKAYGYIKHAELKFFYDQIDSMRKMRANYQLYISKIKKKKINKNHCRKYDKMLHEVYRIKKYEFDLEDYKG